MEVERDKASITVSYRGKNVTVEVPSDATVGVLGKQLSQATGVAISTMRLLVPKGKRVPAAAVMPANEPHSSSTLEASGITPGVVIRMMGASAEEVKEVSRPVKEERVLGFKEEERRQILRRMHKPSIFRLPDGPYTFHNFKTLELPSVTLSPPPEKALALMHKLASDPGIVAIMRKYEWQVGVMTELAPEGYVGVSPKCLLGYNKNRGQEISLRLRTDDLQGFRKYESIKKTLLHELAHMEHDEHDEDFHFLDKLLNREVVELDWTHGHGHTLSGFGRPVDDDDEPMDAGGVKSGYKLGGDFISADAREAAVLAARDRYQRSKDAGLHVILNEPSNSDDSDDDDTNEILVIEEDMGPPTEEQIERTEPDPDDARASSEEPDPDDSTPAFREPDPDDEKTVASEPGLPYYIIMRRNESMNAEEPDPDDQSTLTEEPDPDDESKDAEEPDPDDESIEAEEPDPDDESMNGDESDDEEVIATQLESDDEEVIEMQLEAAAALGRLQLAVISIKNQAASTAELTAALNTLAKIVNNLISNPNDDKYKHIRKVNPAFQERLGRFRGGLDFLREVGFKDEESEYVLRRLDFGLLFLARSVVDEPNSLFP